MPSDIEPGERLVALPASASAKLLLLNEVVEQGISNAELARRMGMTRQEVGRVLDLSHTTKIDAVSQAIAALGKRLEISVV